MRKTILLCPGIFIALFMTNSLFSQNYYIGNTVLVATDSSRNNRIVSLQVYYPASYDGTDAPVSEAPEGGFPVISFGHGYMMPVSDYENLWTAIVPQGYIFVLPDSETQMFPSHREFGLDILFAARQIIRDGKDTRSIFHNKVRNSYGLMGHSMGGGSAILGAEKADDIGSLTVLAPFVTRPSSAEAAKSVSIPSLVFTGSHDFITPARKHARPIYESLAAQTRIYINIKGGNHCNMGIKNRLCEIAERTKPEEKISREQQHEVLNRYLIPWLNFTLKDNRNEEIKLYKLLESDTGITYERSGNPII